MTVCDNPPQVILGSTASVDSDCTVPNPPPPPPITFAPIDVIHQIDQQKKFKIILTPLSSLGLVNMKSKAESMLAIFMAALLI